MKELGIYLNADVYRMSPILVDSAIITEYIHMETSTECLPDVTPTVDSTNRTWCIHIGLSTKCLLDVTQTGRHLHYDLAK